MERHNSKAEFQRGPLRGPHLGSRGGGDVLTFGVPAEGKAGALRGGDKKLGFEGVLCAPRRGERTYPFGHPPEPKKGAEKRSGVLLGLFPGVVGAREERLGWCVFKMIEKYSEIYKAPLR